MQNHVGPDGSELLRSNYMPRIENGREKKRKVFFFWESIININID